ncbi:MAG: hypothetical protein A2098_02680, partial [Chlamydiae bacterium GWF2_49_8]
EWTDATWSPVTGCTKVSAGCRGCYAERLFPRVYGRDLVVDEGGPRPRKFTDVLMHQNRLEQPLHWKQPRRVFVNSMSDLFHEDIPNEFIVRVFAVMAEAQQHVFQVLTKRPKRMLEMLSGPWINWNPWPLPNVHLLVSIENQETANERIPLLLRTPAAVRGVSAEPLLGPVDFTRIPIDNGAVLNCLNGFEDYRGPEIMGSGWGSKKLQWVIAGCESGPKARPMDLAWVRSIRDQCTEAGVPLFVKQLTGRKVIKNLEDFPEDLRIRQYPGTWK